MTTIQPLSSAPTTSQTEKGSAADGQGNATSRSRAMTSGKTLPLKNQKREVFRRAQRRAWDGALRATHAYTTVSNVHRFPPWPNASQGKCSKHEGKSHNQQQ